MKKYTANYVYANPNFVIQNLITNQVNEDLAQILYVLKNILQRGFPTILSKYLQSQIGEIYKYENYKTPFVLIANQNPEWIITIKGDSKRNYYPAKDFFEKIIPNEFGEYSFIQQLLIPEIKISEIVDKEDERFVNQQVDFYLPQAKLVIEIDGQQHKCEEVTRLSDSIRDKYLEKYGIKTVRIETSELKNGSYTTKIENIINHIDRYRKNLNFYKITYEKLKNNQISEEDFDTKLLPTAIIRFQILLVELLVHNYLTFDEDWNFSILNQENLKNFAELAINDLLIWVDHLWVLKNKTVLKKPKINIYVTDNKKVFFEQKNSIKIDFSLFKRYTDENEACEDVIFVRTDYFDNPKEKNYFKVSTAEPINYRITDEDREILEFFLLNIFVKESFREGQFQIISNALNRKDTIGLLPTGGGKSLCYQLPCLLQPSVNFIVCPIISLMLDQKDNLNSIFVNNVNYIAGNLSASEKKIIEQKFKQGQYLFVWISPERFQIPAFRDTIRDILSNFSIAYAVIDEVHCLSEWGHDFRTSYLNLAKTIDSLSPRDVNGEGKIKFIGLTATASVNVLKDIKIEFSRQKQRLDDENIKSLLDYSRKELNFEVINDGGNKIDKLVKILNDLKETEGFLDHNDKAGLIFTPNVNGDFGCYSLANSLNAHFEDKVGWFSGDIPKKVMYDKVSGKKQREPIMSRDDFVKFKDKMQNDFKKNQCQLLVATKAFGMGIDKQNIYYTFHYGLPSSVEALYQEAGRAGRWSKIDDNIDKIAKCYVLHSTETIDNDVVDRLFYKETTFAEIKDISDNVGRKGRDIFKQIFLFVQGHNDIQKDYEIILNIIKFYFKKSSSVKIFWNDAYRKLGIKNDVLQKSIYRLSLLGIISDWTTDFVNHFEVKFNSLDDDNIINSISGYINKYDSKLDVKSEILKFEKESILENSILFLLNWIFETISYSRKQSLKTLSDWCSEFKDSDSFKKRIDSYFNFTETTFLLQHIADHPREYLLWFKALYIIESTNNYDDEGNRIVKEIYIPEISGLQERSGYYLKLKDSISRFLESNKNNEGLNFLSGFVRLALNEYDDSDGRMRFESALLSIKENFTYEQQNDFLSRLKYLAKYLSEDQQAELIKSVSNFFPVVLKEFAEFLNLEYFLNDFYLENLTEFKKLNEKLYEQLAEI